MVGCWLSNIGRIPKMLKIGVVGIMNCEVTIYIIYSWENKVRAGKIREITIESS
jgi:hypothetical protein